jgi:hypothetical protein
VSEDRRKAEEHSKRKGKKTHQARVQLHGRRSANARRHRRRLQEDNESGQCEIGAFDALFSPSSSKEGEKQRRAFTSTVEDVVLVRKRLEKASEMLRLKCDGVKRGVLALFVEKSAGEEGRSLRLLRRGGGESAGVKRGSV